MNKYIMIVALVLFSTSAMADEKTITPKEFGTAIAETPAKVVNFINNEVDKTKEYQKKSWAEMKTKWPWNKLFTKKDSE
tara:strand:- start:435 stop:671 length:237 start_codon:yes stop_codon:yes gene_type:complete